MKLDPNKYKGLDLDTKSLGPSRPLEGKIDIDEKPKRTGRIQDRNPKSRSTVSLYLTNNNLQSIMNEIKEELIRSGKSEDKITEADYRGKMSMTVDFILSKWYGNNQD